MKTHIAIFINKLIKVTVVIAFISLGYFVYNFLYSDSSSIEHNSKTEYSSNKSESVKSESGKKALEQKSGFPVEVAKVRHGEVAKEFTTIGTIKSDESVKLKPEIDGRIAAIHVAEGSLLKQGDLIISIDDRVMLAELKQAEAAFGLAQVSYNRAKKLKEKGAGTVSNFDNMQAALKVTAAQVDLARAKLEKTKITAPFDGIIGLRQVSPGDYIKTGQEMAGFSKNNPAKIEFSLPEAASIFVSSGQKINVVIDALSDHEFSGEVYAVEQQIDPESRNIALRALIPNDNYILKPGMFARVKIIVSEKQSAFFIPESAIIPHGADNFVMKVNPDHKVVQAKVKIVNRLNGEVQITEGLHVDDLVVTAGHMKIREGQEITAMEGATP